MSDNTATTASKAGVWTRGTGPIGEYFNVYGNGWAGEIVISVDSTGAFTVNSFQVDVIDKTGGGDLAQYGPVGAMSGTIDSAGNISFNPSGRIGAVSSFDTLVDKRWNVNLNAPNWTGFTTGGTSYTGTISMTTGTDHRRADLDRFYGYMGCSCKRR